MKYKGNMKNDKPHGEGTFYRDGKVIYEGEWKNGYYHVGGSKWYSYCNDKIEKVIPLKKGKIPKCLNKRFSIEEVEDEKTSKVKIWTFYGIVVVLFVLLIIAMSLIIRTIYIDSCQCDLIRNLDKSITELVIPEDSCRNAKRLDLSGFKQLISIVIQNEAFYETKKVVIKSLMIAD